MLFTEEHRQQLRSNYYPGTGTNYLFLITYYYPFTSILQYMHLCNFKPCVKHLLQTTCVFDVSYLLTNLVFVKTL